MGDQCWGRDLPEGLQPWATRAELVTSTATAAVGDHVPGEEGR